jgi:hypothetical protein
MINNNDRGLKTMQFRRWTDARPQNVLQTRAQTTLKQVDTRPTFKCTPGRVAHAHTVQLLAGGWGRPGRRVGDRCRAHSTASHKLFQCRSHSSVAVPRGNEHCELGASAVAALGGRDGRPSVPATRAGLGGSSMSGGQVGEGGEGCHELRYTRHRRTEYMYTC